MADSKDVKLIKKKVCLSTNELCSILGITRQALSKWETKGCPKEERGWWAIGDVLKWRGLNENSEDGSGEDTESKSLQTQKLTYEVKYKKAQSEATEFKNAISKGEYLTKEEIISELNRYFIILKRSMLGYSRKVATEISCYVGQSEARRVEKLINDLTINALEQLSIRGIYEAPKEKKGNRK